MVKTAQVKYLAVSLAGLALLAASNIAFAAATPNANLQTFGSMATNTPVRLSVSITNFPADAGSFVGTITIANSSLADINSLSYQNGSQNVSIILTQNGNDVVGSAPGLLANMNFDLNFKNAKNYVVGYTLSKSGATISSSALPVTIVSGRGLGISTYNFTRTLSFGMRGNDVTALQQILQAKGYLQLKAFTKYFGPLTRAALKAYQKDNNLAVNGIFDGNVQQAVAIK